MHAVQFYLAMEPLLFEVFQEIVFLSTQPWKRVISPKGKGDNPGFGVVPQAVLPSGH